MDTSEKINVHELIERFDKIFYETFINPSPEMLAKQKESERCLSYISFEDLFTPFTI